ncbi:MAG TPA: AbrB family transcriptional regulator [Noviherbaspirillum sp.]|nr:AbrB family transcriptional regulator [Noviherbaspirillum sp.]
MRFLGPAGSAALLRALLVAVAAAALCVWLKTPLPWMIGPLLSTAAARMAGLDLRAPVQLREAGQWAIGTALGLYFTPAVLQTLASYVGCIVAAVLFALLLGAACGWLLQRLTGIDRTTAFFAMATGGASEMATQGERHGALVDRVAAAHSLRIMLVVVIIPFGFRFAGVHGADPYVPGAKIVALPGLLALIALTSCGALLLRRLQWPNAWVIGPLLVAIALTANGVSLSALPQWMVNCGQLFIGLSLGTRFTPAFVHTAPRYLGGVALCGLAALLAAAAFGLLLALLSGIDPATAILATSPGGIAEMSLTAKTLHLGVPIVTAFHVTRMAVLVLSIGPLFRLIKRQKAGV